MCADDDGPLTDYLVCLRKTGKRFAGFPWFTPYQPHSGGKKTGGTMPTGKTRSLLIAAASLALLAPMSPAIAVTSTADNLAVTSTAANLAVSSPASAAPPNTGVHALQAAPDALGYWTPERMESAVPVDNVVTKLPPKNIPMPGGPTPLGTNPGTMSTTDGTNAEPDAGAPGIASHPVMPTISAPTDGMGINAVEPKISGRLFFVTPDGKHSMCTASTVNSSGRDLIMTAGHCVYKFGSGWNGNLVFAPAYRNGVAPYGLWNANYATTFQGWVNDRNYNYDQAFVKMFPRGGQKIVNALGGNGLSFNYGPVQSNVRIMGWPVDGRYAGNRVGWYCDGGTFDSSLFDSDARMNCDMTGGASGGPWLRNRLSDDLGYVFAVTSRRTTSGTAALLARPFTTDVYNLFSGLK